MEKWFGSKVAIAPVAATPESVTPASELMTSGSLNIGTAAGLVVWIPNEGHHGPESGDIMADVNGVFLPEKAVIPTGAEVVWLSDDAGHDHTISVTGGEKTESIKSDAYSQTMTFSTAGTFAYESEEYAGEGQKGSIEVSATAAVPGTVVGAAFVPTDEVDNATSTLQAAGITVLSTHPFTKEASGQSVSDNTCLVYSGTGTALEVAEKLTAITKLTPYS